MNSADSPVAKRRFRRPAARKRPAAGPAFRNDSQTKTSDVNPDATKAIELLRRLVALPSPSGREEATAELLRDCLAQRGAAPERLHNNVWARSAYFDPARPTLLLNSHHDTVRPAAGYTRDPYDPAVEGDRLYGLGSNDAGASLVALTETFLALHRRPLSFNLVLALTAEEECSGPRGIGALLPELEQTAQAFRTLCDSLRSAFRGPDNDNDVATVFDRAAGRQCRACTLRDRCWKTDYNTTFNALNDATPAMVERGGAGGESRARGAWGRPGANAAWWCSTARPAAAADMRRGTKGSTPSMRRSTTSPGCADSASSANRRCWGRSASP